MVVDVVRLFDYIDPVVDAGGPVPEKDDGGEHLGLGFWCFGLDDLEVLGGRERCFSYPETIKQR